MSGMLMAFMGGGGSALPSSLAAGQSNGTTSIGLGTATGKLRLNTDGSIQYLGTASETGGGGPSRWASRVAAGIGNTIYVKATATTGTFTTNGAAAYTLLSALVEFTKAAVSGGGSCTFTLDFSYDGVNSALSSPGWIVSFDHI